MPTLRPCMFAVVLSLMGATAALSVSLQPGWPQATGNSVVSSPALGDLDGDGRLEVVVGSDDGKVYAWRADGTPVTGWPQTTAELTMLVQSSPALGDLDRDGRPEVVVGAAQFVVPPGTFKIYAWNGDGTRVPGWPRATGDWVQSSPALGDLDGDGYLEVVVGSNNGKVYVCHHDGAPVTGWPQTAGGWVRSSPALGDLDGDGSLEVVVGCWDGEVYAWHSSGAPVPGWPQPTGDRIDFSSPALGDLDGDGRPEVVVGSRDGKVYAWHGDGTPASGWPQATGGRVDFGSPALGDLDRDSALDVVMGSEDGKVYAWHGDGAPLPGWPQPTGDQVMRVNSSPALGDLDGDGQLEVVVGAAEFVAPPGDFKVLAWHADGTPLPGWPQPTGGHVVSSPALGDLDGDGDLEVVVGSGDAKVYAWSTDVQTRDPLPWPMFRHDAQHTAVSPAVSYWLAGGSVAPAFAPSGATFTYRVGYTGLLPPTRVDVAVSSLHGTEWYQMAESYPSDTNCADGKWYTYSSTPPAGLYAYRFRATLVGGFPPRQEYLYSPSPAGSSHNGPVVLSIVAPFLSEGSLSPASGASDTVFTYRVKYTGELPPALVDVGILPFGDTWWRPMAALDPADTNYADGKWYTYSSTLPAGLYAYRFRARVLDSLHGMSWRILHWPWPAQSFPTGPNVGSPPPHFPLWPISLLAPTHEPGQKPPPLGYTACGGSVAERRAGGSQRTAPGSPP
jgi:hypothetical protein